MLGETDDGPTVECRVEKSLIGARTSPNTVAQFCCQHYTDCPSWRAAKEFEWARKRGELVAGPVQR